MNKRRHDDAHFPLQGRGKRATKRKINLPFVQTVFTNNDFSKEIGFMPDGTPYYKTAENCANWINGFCESCGAQSQFFEVSENYRCPYFKTRKSKND